jgi:signal transduction histidine kinase
MSEPAIPEPTQSSNTSPESTVEAIQHLVDANPELAVHLRDFAVGARPIEEGAPNHRLFVILDGALALFKSLPGGGNIEVSRHGRGDMVGVHSFATDNRSFCTAEAVEPTRALRLGPSLLESLPTTYPDLHRLVQRLIVANLAGRYRSAVQLQVQLSEANRELTETRNRLIHQEKLAVLGQLAAGVAHEVNNPVAAIQRHSETLKELLPALLESAAPGLAAEFWSAGLASPGSLATQRDAMETLAAAYPAMSRAIIRRVAALPPQLYSKVIGKPTSANPPPQGAALIAIFECAFLLRHMGSGAQQISHLVKKLKEYARPASIDPEVVDVSESIEGSFVVLNPLINRHQLSALLPHGLKVSGRATSLTQIWTNLIKNACEAMESGGTLSVQAFEKNGCAVVEISDDGPGIPEELKHRIFDVNFTTKTGGENFGLGLGLSITRSLINENEGALELKETPGGGCTFRVSFPLVQGSTVAAAMHQQGS